MLFASLAAMLAGLLTGTSASGKEQVTVTGKKTYTLIVASEKISGMTTSCGNNIVCDMYAVRKKKDSRWHSLYHIDGFHYEQGYEYRIRVRETHCLDYRRGEPAWTEYKLLRVISRKKKDSENLPDTLIPEWFTEE